MNNSKNIIEDFLLLNQEINNKVNSVPKYFKNIYKKIFIKNYKNKLKKVAYKINDTDFIITIDNIKELFGDVFSTFSPNGSFGCIKMISFNTDINSSKDYIVVKGIIDIESDDKIEITYANSENRFDISMRLKNNNKSKPTDPEYNHYTFSGNKLETTNNLYSDTINKINKALIKTISEYIVYCIDEF